MGSKVREGERMIAREQRELVIAAVLDDQIADRLEPMNVEVQ